jgi:hypothetical protein
VIAIEKLSNQLTNQVSFVKLKDVVITYEPVFALILDVLKICGTCIFSYYHLHATNLRTPVLLHVAPR